MNIEKRLTFSKFQLKELLVLTLLLLLSYLFRETPSVKPGTWQDSKGNVTALSVESSNITKKPEESNFILAKKEVKSLSALKRRNPFSFEGSYLDYPIPDPPYKLVAVKTGGLSEAIIRDYTGTLRKVKPNEVLPDGSRVIKIGSNFVELKRLDKKYRITIYGVEVEKWRPKKPFGS